MEGTEDSAFGAVRGFRVVDTVDEEGEADYVREQDEFLQHTCVSVLGCLRLGVQRTCRTSVQICPT